jgi:hypothetical protein
MTNINKQNIKTNKKLCTLTRMSRIEVGDFFETMIGERRINPSQEYWYPVNSEVDRQD